MDLRGGWDREWCVPFLSDPCLSLAFLCTVIFISSLGLTFFEGYVKRKGLLIAQTFSCFPFENLACEFSFHFPPGHCCFADLCYAGQGWSLAAPIPVESDMLAALYQKCNQENIRAALPKVFSVEHQCFLRDVRKGFFIQMSLVNGTLNKSE